MSKHLSSIATPDNLYPTDQLGSPSSSSGRRLLPFLLFLIAWRCLFYKSVAAPVLIKAADYIVPNGMIEDVHDLLVCTVRILFCYCDGRGNDA